MIRKLAIPFLMLGAAFAAPAGNADYSEGIFVINEDWYGHQNSTVNYLLPDDADGNFWRYRVIQTENPGKELGCTNQFGAIWNGRFYLIAKQAKDPGASVKGGRITVADAKSMEVLHQKELIDPSGATCDGRAFIGVDSHKGYISTTNGVWILNLDNFEINGQVEGTENSNPKNLYKGQCGSMVEAAGRIFVAHQSAGLLVIDPALDRVVATVAMTCVSAKAGIGSVVKSKDDNLWVSVAKDTNGSGSTLPYLVKVDPESLETTLVPLADGVYAPSNSWYAWTPDTFCASSQSNTLYWSGGASSWFTGEKVFKFDIDSESMSMIIDLTADGENWKIYGCSMRVDPSTDYLYMSLYQGFSSQTYVVRRYTADGARLNEYPMIDNYWFPSLFVFQPDGDSGVDEIIDDAESSEPAAYFNLNGVRVDADNLTPGVYIRRIGNKTDKILIR